MANNHYRWDTRRQQWRGDGAELALVLGAVALFVALLAVVLVTLR
jgi:hypothetical protein